MAKDRRIRLVVLYNAIPIGGGCINVLKKLELVIRVFDLALLKVTDTNRKCVYHAHCGWQRPSRGGNASQAD
jgi:hypothetical protein